MFIVMKKVMCVDSTTPSKVTGEIPPIELKDGCVYTKIGEHISKESGILLYEFSDLYNCYGAFRFIPLSTIDETELMEQREGNLQSL